jgi:hypothetical protein
VLPVMREFLEKIPFVPETDWQEFEPYTARAAARKQVDFFNSIVAP